ncbi:MAG TPA: GAF domain-containing protein, partial [Polyangiales bacterium]|nr:GAF domain-containing protein [Polyangiales bacterium]
MACWSEPIRGANGAVLGTFAMYYREKRKPSRQEITWVEAATHLASVAIVHDRDATSLRRDEARARRLTRLYDVASSINEAVVKLRTESEICRVVCQLAVDKRLALSAWVGVYVESELRIEPIARAGGEVDQTGDPSAYGTDAMHTSALRAVQDGAAVVCNHVEIACDGDESRVRSFAAFPLRLLSNKRGVFALSADAADAFDSEEIKVLSSLSEHITFAIESLHNARERELLLSVLEERTGQLERTERRLSLLDQLGEQLLLAETAEDVLPLALRMLGLHLRVNRCIYGLFDPSGDRCTVPADYTDGTFSIAGEYRISNFGPAIAEILRQSGPLAIRDVRAELPHEEASALERLDMRAFICCALLRQGSVRALMAVHSTVPREWSAEEISTV